MDITTNSPRRKRSRRSFQPQTECNTASKFVSGKRVGPDTLRFPENEEKDMLFADREKETFLWCMLRFCCSPRQIVPSWTGYNISIHEGVPILTSTIRYLDCIDAPATELSTIYQVCFTNLTVLR